MIFKLESGNQIEVTCWNIKIVMARHALPLQIIPLIGRFYFKKLKCYVFCHLNLFRISNLVAAKGRAVPFVVKLFLVAALLRQALYGKRVPVI